MDAMSERFESLAVDEDDALPYRRRRAPGAWPFYRNVLLLLTLIGLGGYGFWYYTDLPRRIGITPPEIPAAPALPRFVPSTPEPLSQVQPQLKISPKPLADCMGADNLIDEDVATCRFGQMPQPVYNGAAQGLVSTQYLAQYKADQRRAATAQARHSTVVWSTVRRWDGKGSYPALWTLTDNRIEGTSVCTNLRKGSIDYRECRKGAKVHFREQCRVWRKRLAEKYSDNTKAQQQRYCSAAQVFNPLG